MLSTFLGSFNLLANLYFHGFYFDKSPKAFDKLRALDANLIAGESFKKTDEAVEKIGNNVILNTFSNIEHDAIIGDHCHISTGTMVNGECSVGNSCFIGSQSSLANGIVIGDEIIVGAGSFVKKSILAKGIYFGNPAILKL